jgi:2-polyprenyl-6-methoxyphenol hydroxylase-like FAD-dependent oxidoreductase
MSNPIIKGEKVIRLGRNPRPPGPPGHWMLGTIRAFQRDPLRFLLELTRQYGDLVFLRFLGWPVYLVNHPEDIKRVLQEHHRLYNEPGRQVLAYGTPQAGELLILFMYQSAKPEHLPREQRLQRLREVFAGMGWITQQFLSDVSPSESVFMDAVIQIQMPTWQKARVALVGDACDCPTLLSGQGASLAMGGAYLLARALHETADYQEAFRRYEQQMFAYVQAQQKSARGFAKSFLPGSHFGLFVQQTLMKVLLRSTFRGLLRRQFGAESLLQM